AVAALPASLSAGAGAAVLGDPYARGQVEYTYHGGSGEYGGASGAVSLHQTSELRGGDHGTVHAAGDVRRVCNGGDGVDRECHAPPYQDQGGGTCAAG